MATAKKNSTAPSNFGSLTSNIIEGAEPPMTTPKDTLEKDRATSFFLKGSLRQPLDRVIHGLGKKASLRSVMNDALAYYFENDPKAKRLANKPLPDEENEA